jgi:hypothetical protein
MAKEEANHYMMEQYPVMYLQKEGEEEPLLVIKGEKNISSSQ